MSTKGLRRTEGAIRSLEILRPPPGSMSPKWHRPAPLCHLRSSFTFRKSMLYLWQGQLWREEVRVSRVWWGSSFDHVRVHQGHLEWQWSTPALLTSLRAYSRLEEHVVPWRDVVSGLSRHVSRLSFYGWWIWGYWCVQELWNLSHIYLVLRPRWHISWEEDKTQHYHFKSY